MIAKEQVEAVLAGVYDPCSVQANAPLSVVNMGLVTGIELSAQGDVVIRLRPTSPWCTMIGSIMQAVEEQVGKIDGAGTVRVEIDRSSLWSEAELSEEGRQILDGARARARAVRPVRQRQWQLRAAISEV